MAAQRDVLVPIFEKWYDQNAKLSKKGHGSGDPSKTGNSVFFHGGNLDNMSNDEIEKIMESHRFDVAYSVSGNGADEIGKPQLWIHYIDTNDKDIDWQRYMNGK